GKKEKAGEITHSVKGVMEVINTIEVKYENKTSDKEVETAIREAFNRNSLLKSEKIQIESENGVVSLFGFVPNHLLKYEALNTALYTRGVNKVVDNIEISIK
ncbi:MAG: BON domain-containing protein, partial [Bacteroidales bacterium]|nr:BON domain-containing protein [Bacteroidales bacterium]